MSEASPTKQKLDEFRVSLPPGYEHTEPTREMLRVTSYACNGAPGVYGDSLLSRCRHRVAAINQNKETQ